MVNRDQVKNAVLELLAAVTKKDAAEIAANMDASLAENYKLTSLEYFPLLSGLEDKFGAEIDYADFLTNVHTVNEAIDYVIKAIG